MLKQVLKNAGYGYEPKPRTDGDEIWTPCGKDIPKELKPMSKETKDTFNNFRDKITDGSPSVEDLIFSPTPGFI